MPDIPDILSQNEINELLNSLISGNEAVEPAAQPTPGKNKIRDYNFKTPKKLTKEQIKIIMGIYENFARQLASYFSGILRSYTQINVISIEELHYYEYNNALPDTVLIGVIEMNSPEGIILVDISNSITYNLIERSLGAGSREDPLIPEREFSDIEISLMERILKQIAFFTKEAWSGLIKTDAQLKLIETNARLIQSIAMDEIVVIIVMEVTIGNAKGSINVCIPCINIEPVINTLNRNKYSSKRVIDSTKEELIKDMLITGVKAAPLEVTAILGETVLSLREIINLQIGDVIKFDLDVGSNIKLNINGVETWFYGTPGIKKNKKAIKVNKVMQKRGSL
ncbi:MAG: flagellar motor switch protein FliM [Clostridia bacterium]|nr:flagellar motor switch protein FliM [Clostridia bacterium]